MKSKLFSGVLMLGLTAVTMGLCPAHADVGSTSDAARPAEAKTVAALPTYQCVGQDDGQIFLTTNPDQCVRDGFFVEGIVDTGS